MLPLASRDRRRGGLLVLGLIVVASGACASDEPDKGRAFGPLAVVDDTARASRDALGGSGLVDIGERCVTMTRENGTAALLVWRSAEVKWGERDREITFAPTMGDREPVRIRDGDIITIGGAALVFESEDGKPLDRKITWLAEPDESCEGEWWSVESVSVGPGPR